MRTHGTLIKWNDDRGFGFISPAQGSDQLFVHISAFPRDGARPKLNELISYETETTHDGKKRAVRIMRPGGRPPPSMTRGHEANGRSGSAIGTILGVLAIVAIGAYVYARVSRYSQIEESNETPRFVPSTEKAEVPDSLFECDGRTRCAQMTSCAEARYFLQHCPGTKMDGNYDGEPCEEQWCN